MKNERVVLLPAIEQLVEQLDMNSISPARKKLLDELVGYIQGKLNRNEAVNLNFICTHNSRRSQLCQVWAKAIAARSGIRIKSFSGGTEATAFNARAVEALRSQGFQISEEGNSSNTAETIDSRNPVYTVVFSNDCQHLKCFSKRFDHPENQVPVFAAVMTCSDADENCPFIPGAEQRIPVRYEDPKAFDGTPLESEKYAERSRQIATEMVYVFSRIKKML